MGWDGHGFRGGTLQVALWSTITSSTTRTVVSHGFSHAIIEVLSLSSFHNLVYQNSYYGAQKAQLHYRK